MKCLKVAVWKGGEAVRILGKLGLREFEFKILRDNGFLLIPIKQAIANSDLEKVKEKIGFFEVVECEAEKVEKRKTSIVEFLRGRIPEEMLKLVPSSFDVVGHVAIIKIPEELRGFEGLIGQALIETHKNIKTVLARETAVGGRFRLRGFRLVAGEDKTETFHRENGCIFFLDVKKAFFSPRLAGERLRVSGLVGEGETVVDMFAGVGPFSILIAKRHRNVRVYAVDINPDAFSYLKKNIVLNRVEGKVLPILGDIEVVAKEINGKIDRAIMNLPEDSFKHLKTAYRLLDGDGFIHFYCFEDEPNPIEKASGKVKEVVEGFGGNCKIVFGRLVKEIAPRRWMVGLDILLKN